MVKFYNPIRDWYATQNEIVAWSRSPVGTQTPSGAVVGGRGQCGVVWTFDETASQLGKPLAVKLYQRNGNMPVADLMRYEKDTYERLSPYTDNGLPEFFGSDTIVSEDKDGEAFAYLLMEKIAGKTLTFDDVNMLHPAAKQRWAHDLIVSTLKLEKCLADIKANGEAPENWDKNYAELRIEWMKKWRDTPGKLSDEHFALALKLADIIANATAKANVTPIHMHGDISLPNTMVNLNGMNEAASIVTFVDPLISKGNPAENMRQYTMDAPIAEMLANEYERQSGVAIDRDLMYAVGALTHLYIGLAVPASWPVRRAGLNQCLAKIGLDAV